MCNRAYVLVQLLLLTFYAILKITSESKYYSTAPPFESLSHFSLPRATNGLPYHAMLKPLAFAYIYRQLCSGKDFLGTILTQLQFTFHFGRQSHLGRAI